MYKTLPRFSGKSDEGRGWSRPSHGNTNEGASPPNTQDAPVTRTGESGKDWHSAPGAGMKKCWKCKRIFRNYQQCRLVIHKGKFAYQCRWYCYIEPKQQATPTRAQALQKGKDNDPQVRIQHKP